jgi:glycosyltransferase involved in cell wall biosynthesis
VTRRRLLVLNHYALPLSQGGGTRHIELFSRLDPALWSFEILASNRAPQSRSSFTTDDRHFRLVPIPAYGERNGRHRIAGWIVFALRAFFVGLRGVRPDIVYASTPHLLTPVAGLLIARLRRARFVLEVRDLWPESLIEFGYVTRNSWLHRMLSWLEQFLYRAADHIVIVTPGWHGYLVRKGVDSVAITTVTNGSDPEVFAPRPTDTKLRELLGVEGPIAIYAGAHGPPNALETILDAAAELPEVTFVLFGDGASKPALVRRADDECLTNVVFRDPVPKSDLAKFLWTADIGLHTLADMELFRAGMSPNKLYDYMAAKLPLVSNAGGAAHNLIVDAECGAPAAPDGLADAIRQVLAANAEERRLMGERGHSWLVAHASRQAVVSDLERCLLAVIHA